MELCGDVGGVVWGCGWSCVGMWVELCGDVGGAVWGCGWSYVGMWVELCGDVGGVVWGSGWSHHGRYKREVCSLLHLCSTGMCHSHLVSFPFSADQSHVPSCPVASAYPTLLLYIFVYLCAPLFTSSLCIPLCTSVHFLSRMTMDCPFLLT